MSVDKGQKLNMFGGGDDLATVANEIYGGSTEIPDSGRVVARPTPVMMIWADVKQPRRAIPISVRMHWDGDPLEVVSLLGQWHLVAEQAADATFDVVKLLNGEGEGMDTDNFPSVTQEYLSLVRLAAGIKADGLINPITVIESDGKLLIESGERRWLAFHLLNTYLGEQWARIPAAKGNVNDSVWRQATENTARRQLNPIGMARQIGLLIMAARGTPPIADGTPYLEYEEVVKNGTCDRRFYAQVADGNVHRIPKGMGERIQGAMGLSMEQLSRYRALLRLTHDELINDVLWTRADMENWAEGSLRDISTLPIGKVSEVLQRPQWTLDDLKALKDAPLDRPPSTIGGQPQQQPQRAAAQPPARPIPSEWLGKHASTNSGITGKVVDVTGDWIQIIKDDNNQRKSYHFSEMYIIAAPVAAPIVSPAPAASLKDGDLTVGDTVKTRLGNVGTVIAINGRQIEINVPGHGRARQYLEHLTLVAKAHAPVIHEGGIEDDGDPDVPAQPRQWSEGISIGSRDEVATDKADSGGQVDPKVIIAIGSDERNFLFQLEAIARLTKDEDISAVLNKLLWMTDVDAIALADKQTLKTELDSMYEKMTAAMTGWLQVTFASVLQEIEKTAAQ